MMRPARMIRYFTMFCCFGIFVLLARFHIDRPQNTGQASVSDHQNGGKSDLKDKSIATVPHVKEGDSRPAKTNNDQQGAFQSEITSPVVIHHTASDSNDNDLSLKIDFHDYKQLALDKLRTGPGEHGISLRLDPSEKKAAEAVFQVNGFNGYVSDKIALDRSLRDIRHSDCQTKQYLRRLPTVSIIIPFHEEHWSTLLRTFISAINRAPKNVIKEVFLVDDFSTKTFLKDQLDDYVAKHYPDIVKVLRCTKREGLIRTRLIGAKQATGDVLIFLDSHCECSVNWLPPLLEPIAQNYTTVTCPFIDVIDYDTLEYRAQDEGARGAFNWEFLYKRLPRLPQDSEHPAEPFESPIMAGGLFAINAKWFWELGGYDPGLEIWGGEQYELSFKLWQCGGRMIDIPCSRIGHIYRKYPPFAAAGKGDFLGRNFKRIAEVWMDEYKDHLYNRRPNYYKNIDTLDLTEQRAIREKLHCKPFKWFMTHVAFDLVKRYPPIEPGMLAFDELRHEASKLCANIRHGQVTFDLSGCIKDGKGDSTSGSQLFEFTWHQEIRPRATDQCLDFATAKLDSPVVLFPCHVMGGNQMWRYNVDTQQLHHPASGRCLDGDEKQRRIFMAVCQSDSETQKWIFSKMNTTALRAAYQSN